MDKLNIYAAQFNPTVGDVVGNAAKAFHAYNEAKEQNADIAVFTEGFLSSYPAEDLFNKPDFLAEVRDGIDALVAATKDGPAMLFGAPVEEDGQVYNCAIYAVDGKIIEIIKKQELPNYGVFDDKRNFTQGTSSKIIQVKGVPVGVLVCEDTWFPKAAKALAEQGAKALFSMNGSPFEIYKATGPRMEVVKKRVNETGLPLLYVNQVGGQDGIVFDGHSFALNTDQTVGWSLPGHVERGSMVQCIETNGTFEFKGEQNTWGSDFEQVYSTLVLGLRDYIKKNGFETVVLGLSGGADSALVAAIACDAIGAENVHCIRLPSQYTSDDSNDDAAQLVHNLGCHMSTAPIKSMFNVAASDLKNSFGEELGDLTEQNLQARLRGMTLMANTNQFRHRMLLTTGNKSEMSVGYATLYGDMSGGFNPIKDLWKTEVFELMRWRNQHTSPIGLGPKGKIIPESIITKPPTAELKPGQQDENELGSYPVLDEVLKHIIEKETPIQDIIAAGFDRDYVMKIESLVRIAEYKRRQAAPGIKVSRRALQGDRRYPITNGFRSSGRVTNGFSNRLESHLKKLQAS